MAQFSFNTNDAPEMSAPARGPLPAGDYEMIITRSDIKATKAGTGEYIELEMQVLEGAYSGRRHWERFNVSNPNKQAEDIAKAQLGALCAALGLAEIEDTEDMHDTPFVASLEIDRKDPERNRIIGYKPAGAAAPKAAAKPAAPSRPAPAVAAGARPWAR